MRIPHWPALVCGLVLAATIGRTAVAAPPGGPPQGRVTLANAVDDSDDDDDESDSGPISGGYNPYQPVQHVGTMPDGNPGMVAPDPGGFYDPGMPPATAWPEQSPFSQHRIQETYNSGGLWQYDQDDNFDRHPYFSAEYLYGFGLKPGNHYIGSAQYHALDFAPGFPNVFPQQTTEQFGNFNHNGVMLKTGFWNPDESGAAISGWWLFQSSLDNGLVMRHAVAGQVNTLSPLASIVLDNGDGTATNVPFDTRFFQKHNQEIYGADADLFFAPFFNRNTFKLRMMMGAKYLKIHEDFYVQGDSSNFSYLIDLTNNTLINVVNDGFPPYTMVITSSVTSQLVGPHLGLRYDLGGDKFKLWGQTRFAVAANMDKMNVTGLNTVNPFWGVVLPPSVNKAFVVSSPHTLRTSSGAHISPIIDTSINADFPGFALIPWVNRWAVFKNATMRVGFNYVYVGSVSRPANIIEYRSFEPTIATSARTWFEYSWVNFAVNWNF